MGEIVLYQFLEYTKDVCGREAVGSYSCLEEFFEAFGMRDSVRREGRKREVPGPSALKNMMTWWEGTVFTGYYPDTIQGVPG
jgi:hypothetical protein